MADVSVSNKRIAKNTIFLYIRMALSMIVSLYTVRVVLQVLGVENYGIYSAVGGVISSLTVFTGALSTASQRFFSIEIGKDSREGLNRVFNSMVVLYLLTGVLILIIAETAGVWFLEHKMLIPSNRMNAAFVVLQCTLISLFVSIIVSPFQAIIIAKEDMKVYAYVGIYDVLIKLLIAFFIQLFTIDKLILYAFLLLMASVSSQLIYFIFSVKKYNDIKLKLRWDFQTIKEILGFSGWSLIGCLAFLFNAEGLNLLMNVFFGPIVNAAYNIGNSVKNAVNQLGANFFVAVRPSLIKEYAAQNFEYVQKLFFFSTKVIFCLLFMIMFPISMETERILSLWLGDVGDHMVSFVRLMLIWALLLNLSDPITAIVQAANKVKAYHLLVDLFTLLTLPLAYVAFKFGSTPEWAFIISLIIFCFAHIIRLLILKKIIQIEIIEYFKKIVLRIILSICISISITYTLKLFIEFNTLIGLFVKILLEVAIPIAVCYIVVLNKNERVRINGMLQRLLNKLRVKNNDN